ncbi:MAG: hypothetical protein LBP59_18975 [Planctomycetaceae bacterium]|nr:hypothetical protein [Planctomycetaceae bacterium]
MLSLTGQIFIVTKIVQIRPTHYPLKSNRLTFRERLQKIILCELCVLSG